MPAEFYPLQVESVQKLTADTVCIAFNLPSNLKREFEFIQGQYLTLRTNLNGEDIRRSYSICSSVNEQSLKVAVKQIPGGKFSTWANNDLKPGSILQVMTPQGRFFKPIDPSARHRYVAFAAGSGITPILSIIKTTLEKEPLSSFVLFFGNRGYDHVLFREELEALKNGYLNRFSLHHVFSRESVSSPLLFGRINAEKCKTFSQFFFNPKETDAYFICGPEGMVQEVRMALTEMEVKPDNVLFELFGTGLSGFRSSEADFSDKFEASITIIQDGQPIDFILPSDGSTILDAAMRAGADLPFSCKGGVCSTCKAKVVEGTTTMDLCYGLEPDEIAEGFILTCQAHPTSLKVVVSFDA
jgi:ring-1,2-phenylacetyl-CoA epoxidase subunit PaaE